MVLDEFERIQIAGERNSLKKRLEQKSELLAQGRADLRRRRRVPGRGVGHGGAVQDRPQLRAVRRSRCARRRSRTGFNEEQEQAYRDQLAMFIVPIEERALEAYEGGYRKALELRVFNHWTQMLREGPDAAERGAVSAAARDRRRDRERRADDRARAYTSLQRAATPARERGDLLRSRHRRASRGAKAKAKAQRSRQSARCTMKRAVMPRALLVRCSRSCRVRRRLARGRQADAGSAAARQPASRAEVPGSERAAERGQGRLMRSAPSRCCARRSRSTRISGKRTTTSACCSCAAASCAARSRSCKRRTARSPRPASRCSRSPKCRTRSASTRPRSTRSRSM